MMIGLLCSGPRVDSGALVDLIGYERTFLVPLGFHMAATLVLLPLVRIVPPDRCAGER